jgi:hypothetical protein
MASLTTNTIPKATDGIHIGDSRITDDGTDITAAVSTGFFEITSDYGELKMGHTPNNHLIHIVSTGPVTGLDVSADGNGPALVAQSNGNFTPAITAIANGSGADALDAQSESGISIWAQSGDSGNTAPTVVSQQRGAATANLYEGQSNGGSAVFAVAFDGGVTAGGASATSHTLTADPSTGAINLNASNVALGTANAILNDASYFSLAALATNGSGKIVVAASDARLKDIGDDFLAGLSEIEQITPKEFEWKDGRTKGTQAGLIAQNVQTAIPLAVSAVDDEIGTLQINQNAIIAALVNACKELSARVKELESK